jgi:hypothetical protein
MTLLELVVALAVTGAALAAGYGAFAGVVDSRQALTTATDSVARSAGVRRVLVDWLGGARVGLGSDGPDFRGLDGVAGHLPDDELTFTTDAVTPLGDGGTLVRLFVDRDPRTPERGLTATLAEWGGTRAARMELAPDVEGLDVRYASRVFGGVRWLPSWISRSVLPLAVEITFSPAMGDTLPALLDLPITGLVGDGR